MPQEKVLVVDDEAKIVELVKLYLEKAGYRVATAADGSRGLELFRRERPDLIILDIMLPEIDGLEVCRHIRRESNVPIIMLTAKSEDVDKLIGLELGADDYITKPFSPREVVARVRAVLRRTQGSLAQAHIIAIGGLVIDLDRHQVHCQGQPIELTATEFKLLAALAQNPGRVFTRLQLLDLVQGIAYEGYERTIDTHIKNLRRKLAALGGKEMCRIGTVRGVGYKFQEPDYAQDA
jgi:DNA-binding response OmpR family regulator